MNIPDTFWAAFEQRKDPSILCTVDRDGTPNSIYVGVMRRVDEHIEIVDSAFSKTRDNLLRGSSCSFLFITEEFVAYQLKCQPIYTDTDEALTAAKEWMPTTYTPKAVLTLQIQSIYTGAQCIYPTH
ncbi:MULTISPECIES: pyridoxamine 5'-phosphate oxidase family protein [unclassified Lentimonas]|uniref:pyridoxamine 5'-phosphate oxidase family protein n=1 Tax=unclassified Lentimonas TaxID=2630993 RepID=UPI00132201FB|nr:MULTISPECIES: pyridoxamine 5'-phosphate oxidase family protein [unclassified Lentimonas]CAA6677142.1 Unannotated [Lentimonas sp. CC4]CAA6686234.1 Unannotated [Lentimonas sp. CC6]CAA7074264.1 Unannotated [Lentimonas sp. CC4]CAA7171095.1 Unannotated [Lentimonas sp. CC21]CAA7180907.1 Unannotated [Lentimonas sp. CC8]